MKWKCYVALQTTSMHFPYIFLHNRIAKRKKYQVDCLLSPSYSLGLESTQKNTQFSLSHTFTTSIFYVIFQGLQISLWNESFCFFLQTPPLPECLVVEALKQGNSKLQIQWPFFVALCICLSLFLLSFKKILPVFFKAFRFYSILLFFLSFTSLKWNAG